MLFTTFLLEAFYCRLVLPVVIPPQREYSAKLALHADANCMLAPGLTATTHLSPHHAP